MTGINLGLHQSLSHYNNTKKSNLYLTQYQFQGWETMTFLDQNSLFFSKGYP